MYESKCYRRNNIRRSTSAADAEGLSVTYELPHIVLCSQCGAVYFFQFVRFLFPLAVYAAAYIIIRLIALHILDDFLQYMGMI